MSIRPTPDRQSPESRQRRHLTVMFCDVVGATRLSGERDVEAYFSILHAYYEACRPVVERHGGLIAQHQGDGIYVWYGYPLPRDDDAIRAVRAGLDLLLTLRKLSATLETEIGEPLAVRIAVHAGEVLVAPIAGEPSPLAFGHTPNVAAKLQQAARPDTLVVSAAVLRLIRDSFEVTSRTPVTFADGSVAPVYEIARERHREGRVLSYWRTPMVDRDRERERLGRVWASVRAGHGAAVALVGSRGVGKTRLASTALALATSTQSAALDCACNQLEVSTAYRPFRRLLGQAAGIEPDAAPNDAAALLRSHLLEGLGMDQLAATLLGTVLGLPATLAGPPVDLNPAKLAEVTAALLVEWVTRLAATPTVVMIDDITDADPSTLNVLAQLAAALPPRLLLVFTARSDVAPPPFLAGSTIEIIEVPPLASEVCEALVNAVTVESPLAPRDRQRVLDQGEGIPLFLEELAWAAQDGLNQAGMPITLTGHLQSRLVAPGIDREVAGVLAVAGRDLDASVLATILGQRPEELQDRLDGLLTRDLVVHTSQGSCSSYRFRHSLITEAAYGLLLRENRTRLHNGLAEALTRQHTSGHSVDWSVVGHHLTLAQRPLDAYEALITGADEASRGGAFQEALRGYRDALTILQSIPDPSTRDRLEIRCRLHKGLIVIATSGFTAEEAVEDFGRCDALCGDLEPRPEHLSIFSGLYAFYLNRGEPAAARRFAEKTRRWTEQGYPYFRTDIGISFGVLNFFEGDYELAGRFLTSAIDGFSARLSSDNSEQHWLFPFDRLVALLTHAAVVRWITGRSGEAAEAGAEAIARSATLNFPEGPFSMAYSKSYMGWLSALSGDHETAARLASDVRDIGQRHGFADWVLMGTIHAALADYRVSGRAGAAEVVEQSARVCEQAGMRLFLPYILAAAADTRAAMGHHAAALAGFGAAEALVAETGLCFYEAERLRLLARVLPVPEESRSTLVRAWELAHRQGAVVFELRAALDLAKIAEDVGDSGWAARLSSVLRRFPPEAVYPELEEARELLDQTHRRT